MIEEKEDDSGISIKVTHVNDTLNSNYHPTFKKPTIHKARHNEKREIRCRIVLVMNRNSTHPQRFHRDDNAHLVVATVDKRSNC
ncbi:hypothetical protein ALC53_02826 [Atta colombica]|uniref:Uncharacterized protein n=1 Tax=Atta colombica TaxID=520822 RepID=A0A195BQV6_9HYME|nr:hypothetical protein ALC53_02826 [Atta colombica]